MTCDLWVGSKTTNGYSQIKLAGVRLAVHRLVWMQDHGPIPDGMVVMHACDTPACIEVAHLRLGTQQDNVADMAAKGRHHKQRVVACPKGHPYDDANTYVTPDGRRDCRACRRGRAR